MKIINFRNVNLLNSRVNVLSGNLLPVSGDSQFSVIHRIYSAAVWLNELIYMSALIAGIMLSPKEKGLKDGSLPVAVWMEATVMLTSLLSRKKLMREIVRKMDDILQNADEPMNDIVKAAIKPIITPFIIYAVTSVISVMIWTGQPVVLAFKKSVFYYIDYNLPAAFSTEPFSSRVLIPSTIIMTTGGVYLFLRKFSMDVYMMHLVLMLTAQYRYTASKLTILCRDLQSYDDKSQRERFMQDRLIEKELKRLCRHQHNVLSISLLLKKLLSVNFSVLYVNNVFRFCFVGVLMSTVPSLSLAEGISIVSFSMGAVMQFFLMCSSVQTLSDASTEITDKAFDESWYQLSQPMKRIFILLIMGNNLECKIAAIGKFNLSLPSFMTVSFVVHLHFYLNLF
ncbi:hypothetical protein PUN28_011744 [Cardiocondyla obscurior]|uniref:Odorant receptor n=1 Tax=Cardiocondyla obscurior TaxID=286306 RepID=A0AAW2FL59_9HYME